MSFITREVEIYDNERYQLTAFDFSAKGLLPTDRSVHPNLFVLFVLISVSILC